MATVTSVTKHFPSAKEGFVTTLASTISSGAATVPLNSVTGYSNGEVAVFIIEPGTASAKQAFTGTVDTAGVQLTSVVWTEGTNASHNAGSTVVDYVAATHMSMVTKGLLVEHKQTGAHAAVTADSIVTTGNVTVGGTLIIGGTGSGGWDPISGSISAVAYNGNRSYTATTSADNTTLIVPGMRLRTTRTVAAPTQCTSLNGTTQYYSKSSPAGMTFTDDFVTTAWVKAASYVASEIISRFNNTSGWRLRMESTGQIALVGFNAGGANFSQVSSYQALPLNKWVHIAAQLDMSAFTATTTTSYIMFDGLDIPASVSRGGTNPTALVQAGNLEIGAQNGGTEPFAGKIAQAAIYSAKVTQANIRATISQGLVGTETSLISAYSFNNSINDLNVNANNLTANGSAVATNADSPFGGQASGTISSTLDYGIVTAVSASTITFQVAEGCTIPTTGGVSAMSYSSYSTPNGFPAQRIKWRISTIQRSSTATTSNATYGSYNSGGYALPVPIGSWKIGQRHGAYYNTTTTTVHFALSGTSLTGLTEAQASAICRLILRINSPTAASTVVAGYADELQDVSSLTTYLIYTLGATTSAGIDGVNDPSEIFAELAY